MTNPIVFSTQDNIQKHIILPYMFKNFLWAYYLFRSNPTHISKISKYFRSNFLNVQASEPYKSMLQT